MEFRIQEQSGVFTVKTIAERFLPDSDLRGELERLSAQADLQAGVLLSLVGSLKRARIGAAGGNTIIELEGPLEIVSATGTFAAGIDMNVHICVSDAQGLVKGGHLIGGCTVSTTVEAVIGNLSEQYRFDRVLDKQTGHLELKVDERRA